jgi:hypothetical protein
MGRDALHDGGSRKYFDRLQFDIPPLQDSRESGRCGSANKMPVPLRLWSLNGAELMADWGEWDSRHVGKVHVQSRSPFRLGFVMKPAQMRLSPRNEGSHRSGMNISVKPTNITANSAATSQPSLVPGATATMAEVAGFVLGGIPIAIWVLEKYAEPFETFHNYSISIETLKTSLVLQDRQLQATLSGIGLSRESSIDELRECFDTKFPDISHELMFTVQRMEKVTADLLKNLNTDINRKV